MARGKKKSLVGWIKEGFVNMPPKGKMIKQQLIDFEINCFNLFKQGKINCPMHLSGGNEEQLIKIFKKIRKGDYVLSTHRNHYHYLLKGGNPEKLLNEILGKQTGCCGGYGRSMHIFDKDLRFYTSAIIGGICAIACGIGLAIQRRKDKEKVWCFIGDGAEDTGFFYEAARFAMSRELPIIFIIEDNNLAVEATKKDRWGKFIPVKFKNIIRYTYVRKYPHVGVGKRVNL